MVAYCVKYILMRNIFLWASPAIYKKKKKKKKRAKSVSQSHVLSGETWTWGRISFRAPFGYVLPWLLAAYPMIRTFLRLERENSEERKEKNKGRLLVQPNQHHRSRPIYITRKRTKPLFFFLGGWTRGCYPHVRKYVCMHVCTKALSAINYFLFSFAKIKSKSHDGGIRTRVPTNAT